MWIFTLRRLREFWVAHRDAEGPLCAWHKRVRRARWVSWAEVTADFPKASLYEQCIIFNIGGGKYRLITRRSDNWHKLFVVAVLSHADYDRGDWKDQCEC